jgi:hypothetical protein
MTGSAFVAGFSEKPSPGPNVRLHADHRGTNPAVCAFKIPMTDHATPFAQFSLERALALRWMLRDIKAKRLKLSPVGAGDLATLSELGLIEMRDDAPVLTQAGHNALD